MELPFARLPTPTEERSFQRSGTGTKIGIPLVAFCQVTEREMELRISTTDAKPNENETHSTQPVSGSKPEPILRPMSINGVTSPRNGARPQPTGKIFFADENGGRLVENHFVENLHYSADTSGQQAVQACCTIS